jgi:hypothetical protein
MDRRSTRTDDHDSTLRELSALLDGTVAGLANYHLWELQLREIRNLPESHNGPTDRGFQLRDERP